MNRRNSLKSWALCIFAASGILAPGTASADTSSAEAQIALVTPLSFIQVEDLDFGRVLSSATAGTVSISGTNVRTSTGGVVPVGNDYQHAKFAGMGTLGQRLSISLAPNVITLTGPGAPMTVSNLVFGTDGTLNRNGNSANFRILSANGIFWFHVGGRLNVGANQASGTYRGTFTATLIYQ